MESVRFYLARIVTLALNNFLLVPSALSLLLLLLGFLVEKFGWKKGGRAFEFAANKVTDFYQLFVRGERRMTRWVMGTHFPRVENVKN